MTKKRSRRRTGRGRGRKGTKQCRRMLMNVIDAGEVRVAISGPEGLEELYVEHAGSEYVHGNIFKGKVQNVEPSLQAAFVDIGCPRNGFLSVGDVIPPHGGYEHLLKQRRRKGAKTEDSGKRPPIEEMLHKGQEVLVQITREELGNKGPSLTTYVSLPGRYLVMMPAVVKCGVSRKISDPAERNGLKDILKRLKPPAEYGFIVRTAGQEGDEESLGSDLNYLLRLWSAIEERTRNVKAPAIIYQESDLVIRSIRDYFYEAVDELLIDSEPEYERAREFLHAVMPELEVRAQAYTDAEPLFSRYGVEEEVEKVFARSCRLPCGGEIVIEQTEAMVTVDVNTGSFRKGDSSEEIILAINLEAAAEIGRQLRLRDLGGLVMLDFIDMEKREHRRQVEDAMRAATADDRARITMLPISRLGVMEMTRQRVRQSLKQSFFSRCPACDGTGLRKAPEFLALDFMRALRGEVAGKGSGVVEAYLHPDALVVVNNTKRRAVCDLETRTGCRVHLCADSALGFEQFRFQRSG